MRQLGLWLGSLGSSMCADQVFFLALTWAAIQVGTPAEVGAVVAAASLPRLALLLIGGTLADRVNPRLLAAFSDIGRAAALAATVAVVLAVNLQIWHLIVIGVVVGALDGFFTPAIGALPALIAPAQLMGRVGGMRTVVQRVALLLAGPIAGGAIAWAGQIAGFAVAAALFALSVTFLLLINRPPTPATTPPTDPAPLQGQAARPSLPPFGVGHDQLHPPAHGPSGCGGTPVQKAPSWESPTSKPSASRRPSPVTPVAITTAWDTTRCFTRALQ